MKSFLPPPQPADFALLLILAAICGVAYCGYVGL